MAASVVELDEEFQRIHQTWQDAGTEGRKAKLDELNSVLEQL